MFNRSPQARMPRIPRSAHISKPALVTVAALFLALAVILGQSFLRPATAGPFQLVESRDIEYTNQLGDPRKLDVFAPADADGLPVVVMFHGNPPDRKTMEPLAKAVSERGAVVFNVSTSHIESGGTVPQWYQDVSCAELYASVHAEDFGGDPSKITFVGFSGGAGVALPVALAQNVVGGNCVVPRTPAFPQARAFVSVAGDYYDAEFITKLREGTVFDLDFWLASFSNNPAQMEQYLKLLDARAQLTTRKERGSFPIRIIGGVIPYDNTAPASRWYPFVNAASLAGYDVQMRVLSRTRHNGFLDPTTEGFRVVVDEITAVMRK